MPLFISILFILQLGRFAIAKKCFEVKGETNNRNDFKNKRSVQPQNKTNCLSW